MTWPICSACASTMDVSFMFKSLLICPFKKNAFVITKMTGVSNCFRALYLTVHPSIEWANLHVNQTILFIKNRCNVRRAYSWLSIPSNILSHQFIQLDSTIYKVECLPIIKDSRQLLSPAGGFVGYVQLYRPFVWGYTCYDLSRDRWFDLTTRATVNKLKNWS